MSRPGVNSGERPSIVLMDCHMPGLDGFEATRKIRSLEEASGQTRTPVIALTADVSEDSRERCLASGMDDFMVKPYSLEDLRDMLVRWIGDDQPASASDLPA